MNVSYTSSNATMFNVNWTGDDEPSLGVREPRRPRPSGLVGGAAAPLHFDREQEAEGIADGARVNAASWREAVSPLSETAA